MHQVLAVLLGYPCCSLSAQNVAPKSIKDKKSSSGGGYDAFIKFVKSSPQLQLAILENVQGMLSTRRQFDSEKPIEIQEKAMRKLGFTQVFALKVNSSQYGLAQSRTRCWALYIRDSHFDPFFDFK